MGLISLEVIDERLANRGCRRASPYAGTTAGITDVECLNCGHIWPARVSRIFSGCGCPRCAVSRGKSSYGKRWTLEMVDSKLAERGIERAADYIGTTTKKTPLRCKRCRHEWEAKVTHIIQGRGCPKCARKATLTKREVEDELSQRGISIVGKYSGSTKKPVALECITCGHTWCNAVKYILYKGAGCPSCARDPWLKQGIYHLHHPQFKYQYVGISWKPEVRLTEHQQDEGLRGGLARMLDSPYEFTFQEVFDIMDVARGGGRLPEYVLNWVEQNPHGELPHGRLWFVEWDDLTHKELNEPARVPRFVADWVETEMIELISINFDHACPFVTAGKYELVNIAKNRPQNAPFA